MSPGYRGKRALDLAISVPALVASLPIQAAIALAVRRRLGTPVLFRQTRPGLHGEPFELVKFRSMRDIDEAAGLVTDAQRLTAFGVWLRSTSLDELPSLWNVVKGDMSIVGPRPLLMRYLTRYTPEQARRHDVRPGLTGLAQISGRNAISWEQKFALDAEYAATASPRLDLRIILGTVKQVFRRDGITADNDATMPEFLGLEGQPV
ncbi:sugar transferase [Nostocoides jenkinsii]|uniref:Putative phosphotransferase involved in extracellular matrix synthesis n=1 Tax=Nostocoides jenkinsii Ben 74 TaxID=1193518 RepID=A0A077M629_9MICO|nr:sugar transferase [Tetrasphaera jenkinsii]CCI52024.1 putative phosphotransferase involved in extracellular matrix synthesis [Tetrasphaera jenkinsii Ben 74]